MLTQACDREMKNRRRDTATRNDWDGLGIGIVLLYFFAYYLALKAISAFF
jgi:hypothetical protein